jgi:hypothetical protein
MSNKTVTRIYVCPANEPLRTITERHFRVLADQDGERSRYVCPLCGQSGYIDCPPESASPAEITNEKIIVPLWQACNCKGAMTLVVPRSGFDAPYIRVITRD